jgi:hypothetical protein
MYLVNDSYAILLIKNNLIFYINILISVDYISKAADKLEGSGTVGKKKLDVLSRSLFAL